MKQSGPFLRAFPLIDVLSVMTGGAIALGGKSGMIDLVAYVTGEGPSQSSLLSARQALVQQHPALEGVSAPPASERVAWVNGLRLLVGDEVYVTPISSPRRSL